MTTSTSKVISSITMVRSRAPTIYIAQSGKVGWAEASVGNGGGGDDGCGGVGDGSGGGGCSGGSDSSGAEDGLGSGNSVMKAPTALQALWLPEPLALTFQ